MEEFMRLLKLKRNSPHTVKAYRHHLENFFKFRARPDPDKITFALNFYQTHLFFAH